MGILRVKSICSHSGICSHAVLVGTGDIYTDRSTLTDPVPFRDREEEEEELWVFCGCSQLVLTQESIGM